MPPNPRQHLGEGAQFGGSPNGHIWSSGPGVAAFDGSLRKWHLGTPGRDLESVLGSITGRQDLYTLRRQALHPSETGFWGVFEETCKVRV